MMHRAKCTIQIRDCPRAFYFRSSEEYNGFNNFYNTSRRQIWAASRDTEWIDTLLQLSVGNSVITDALISVGTLSQRFQERPVV